MSFTSGFSQGVKDADAHTANQRRERAERLSKLVNGFELDSSGEYKPNERGQLALDIQTEKLAQQLTYVREQNQMLEDKVTTDGMTKLTQHLIYGSANDANMELNTNPSLKNRLAKAFGINRIEPMNWDSEADRQLLAQEGIVLDEEALNDPKKRQALNSLFARGHKADGSVGLIHTPSLVAQTNFNGYVDNHTKKQTSTMFNQIKEILGGHLKTKDEIRAENAKREAGIAVNNATQANAELSSDVTHIKKQDIENFMQENPNATLKDYMSHIAPDTRPSTQDPIKQAQEIGKVEQIALKNQKLKEEIKLKRQKLEAKASTGDVTSEEEKELKQIKQTEKVFNDIDKSFDTLLKDGKIDNATLAKMDMYKTKYLNGSSHKLTAEQRNSFSKTVRMNNQMARAIDIINDPRLDTNAVVNNWAKVKKYIGLDSKGQLNINDPEQFNALAVQLAKSRTGIAVVNFIKAISGSQVTDEERTLLTNLMTGGENVDISTMRLLFNDFYSNQRDLALNTAKGLAKTSPSEIFNMLNNNPFIKTKGKKFDTKGSATTPTTQATPTTPTQANKTVSVEDFE